ncbi:MAG: transglutaminase domain-containing protein [Flavobacteriales bacterium]|nr:transglutaminase domain-containing protein [Flavobacteriales bacterium]
MLLMLVLLVGFAFWLSPRLGGLIDLGKESIETTITTLSFDSLGTDGYELNYPDLSGEPHLVELRETYQLDTLIGSASSSLEQVLAVQSWVQSRWEHDGDNSAGTSDAIAILRAAEQGQRFRCVEYSVVTSACLASLGFRVRGLGLMTRDIAEVRSGGGHAVNEVYLPDLKRWAFLDPQYNVMVLRDGAPLNAVQFQHAIAHGIPVELVGPSGAISTEDYLSWVGPYLYYFYVSLDRQSISIWDRVVGNKKQLTLYPIGADRPATFQGLIRWNNTHYTHAVRDLYPVVEDQIR